MKKTRLTEEQLTPRRYRREATGMKQTCASAATLTDNVFHRSTKAALS